MNLFSEFSSRAPNKVFISILCGVFSGVAYSLLIPLVISSLENEQGGLEYSSESLQTFFGFEVQNYYIASVFLLVCLFILITRTASQIILLRVSMDVTTKLRLSLYKRIMKAPISKLESLGSSRLIATIATDVGRIVDGARVLPELIMSVTTLVSLLMTLFIVDKNVFWLVFKTIFLGIITYQIPVLLGAKYIRRAREHIDVLQESIRSLIYGAKELKISTDKRESFYSDVLVQNEHAVLKSEKLGNSIMSAATSYGDLISFFVIGFVAFVFANYNSISQAELITVIMMLLYITGPVAEIINLIPEVLQAKISLQKVERLSGELSTEEATEQVFQIPSWEQIRFKDVCFSHETTHGSDSFGIGPLTFSVEKGKITFIVGGNGSGKTTLSKLISLHYRKSSGSIFFGEVEVDNNTLNSCRNEVSAIYSDYHLFDRLLGESNQSKQALIQQYLCELCLEEKVTVENGQFSTTSLSDGQRRRLALLVAFLEDKSLYVFDEWAADQDPEFKQIFYYRILPDLKAQGKAVVVISHDDRYFDIADKLLIMEDGLLKSNDD
ncbi:ABC transporter ATP-binding protein [Pseudoalteromonas sp. A25]|uniref:cyclic peptide export ABC transporter n=1 Tax=Pseudoalteromonas sp. A25 TaxID=116092 RepID=UPI00126052BE|nr:cyclic peptide export ABC transporter [Pseudoalteromonas sp. A25]BBN81236.1 ABC transporter ATP-binding protein [Pseudoalteromonas sp. A25]